MNHLADRVRRERLSRGPWSIRKSAGLGGISNTWWGKFEDGLIPLSDEIAKAVAKAFDWDDDWASQPNEFVELQDRVERLHKVVVRLSELLGFDAEPLLYEPPAQSQVDR